MTESWKPAGPPSYAEKYESTQPLLLALVDAPLPVLEAQMRSEVTTSDFAVMTAAALLHAESSPEGGAVWARLQPLIEKRLVDSGHLFEVCAERVDGGRPSLADLLLVSRAADISNKYSPYKPNLAARWMLKSRNTVDDSILDATRAEAKLMRLRYALTGFSAKRWRSTETVMTADEKMQTVPLVFKPGAIETYVLTQLSIIRELGILTPGVLNPELHDPVRDTQLQRLIDLYDSLEASRRGKPRPAYKMPTWEIESIRTYLSDTKLHWEGYQGITLTDRPWKFLNPSGTGRQEYRAHRARQMEKIPEYDTYYHAAMTASPEEVDSALMHEMHYGHNQDVAAAYWAAVAKRPSLRHIVKKYQWEARFMLEPHLLEIADELTGSKGQARVPIHALTLLVDTYFSLSGLHPRADYPLLVTDNYGSLQQDYVRIQKGLQKWSSHIGDSYVGEYDGALLRLMVAYKLCRVEQVWAAQNGIPLMESQAFRAAAQIAKKVLEDDREAFNRRKYALPQVAQKFYGKIG